MKGWRFFQLISITVIMTLGLSLSAFSSGGGIVTDDEASLSGAARTEPYSPYAQRTFPTMPLWGDTHLHTAISFDAGAFGARLLPPDAYRFAKGEEVISSTGQPVRLSRPLDFLVVADHSDNMGFFPNLQAGAPYVMASEKGRKWHEMIKAGGQEAVKAAVELIVAFLRINSLKNWRPCLVQASIVPAGMTPLMLLKRRMTRVILPPLLVMNGRLWLRAITCIVW